MKRITFLLLTLLCIISSCKKEDSFDAIVDGDVFPPEELVGFRLMQSDLDGLTIKDNFGRNEFAFIFTSVAESMFSYIASPECSQFFRDKYGKVREYCKNNGVLVPPVFFDSGFMEGVCVYSDKEIFGRAPGEDLSDHVFICRHIQGADISSNFPSFDRMESVEENMNICDCLKPGNAVWNGYIATFSFDVIPEDLPNDFTLTIEIPVVNNTPWGDLNLPFIKKEPDYRRCGQTCVYKTSVDIHLTD